MAKPEKLKTLSFEISAHTVGNMAQIADALGYTKEELASAYVAATFNWGGHPELRKARKTVLARIDGAPVTDLELDAARRVLRDETMRILPEVAANIRRQFGN